MFKNNNNNQVFIKRLTHYLLKLQLHYCSKFTARKVLACFGLLPQAQANILVIIISNFACAFFVFWENKVIYLFIIYLSALILFNVFIIELDRVALHGAQCSSANESK